MGRATLLTLTVAILLLGGSLPTGAEPVDSGPRQVATRVIKVGGPLDQDAVRQHIRFSTTIGFNTVWVPSGLAARWTAADAAEEVELRPEFVTLARQLSERDVRVMLVVQPWRDDQAGWSFTDKAKTERLVRLLKIARREAGIEQFVLSFFDAPLRLTELEDITTYGPSSATAQVALARKLGRKLARGEKLWLEPSVTSDLYLTDPKLPYGRSMIESLATLDPRIGLVWSGPEPFSVSITTHDVEQAQRRFGGRPLMLDDRYPANRSGRRIPLALVLGPLREREPSIADRIGAYVTTPMAELGASRLSLLTIGDFLTDPDHYDPDESWRRAEKRLAGEDTEAFEALRTQATEWGGWIGTRNYHTAADDNPATAAASLNDPAEFAAWIWPVRTYPARIDQLGGLADRVFRDELLLTMARRLAVARAAPPAKALLDPSTPAEELPRHRHTIELLRQELASRPEVRLTLDRFLFHAGLSSLLSRPTDKPTEALP